VIQKEAKKQKALWEKEQNIYKLGKITVQAVKKSIMDKCNQTFIHLVSKTSFPTKQDTQIDHKRHQRRLKVHST
jgi:hypothetical protein